MKDKELLDKLQNAIGDPSNKYKFSYTKTKNGYLYIYLIDPKLAAEKVLKLIKDELSDSKG